MFKLPIDGYSQAQKLTAVQNIGTDISVNRSAGSSVVKSVASPRAATADAKVSKAELEDAVKKLNDLVAPALQTVQFSLDEQSNRMVVRVVDVESKEVLRQIPDKEVLAMSRTLDKLQSLMIRQTA